MRAQAEVLLRAVRWEFVRVTGLRSPWVVGGVAVAANALTSLGIASFLAYGPAPAGGYSAKDAATLILSSPPFAALGAGVLGAMVGGLDHRHKLEELTLLVSPRRRPMLMGKVIAATALAVCVAVVGIVCAGIVVGVIGSPMGAPQLGVAFWTTVAVGQTAKVLAWGLAGVLVGVSTRSQTAAIAALVLGSSLAEPLVKSAVLVAPHGWWSSVPQLLPFAAFSGLVPTGSGAGSIFAPGATLTVAASVAVTAGYLVVLLVAADRSVVARAATGPSSSVLVA